MGSKHVGSFYMKKHYIMVGQRDVVVTLDGLKNCSV